jgi:peptidoglycan/xylan/chitin deacetylase (PgdA/CDA1 family)
MTHKPQADQPEPQSGYEVLKRGNAARAEIALTFDDGPYPPFTAQILDTLRSYNVSATFFCIGQQVQQFPELVEQAHRAGHLVENHTWSHRALPTLVNEQEIAGELARCSEAIRGAAGVQPGFFRPPQGEYDEQVLSHARAFGLITTLWDSNPCDWMQPPPDADSIARHVIEHARNGSIVLLHDGGGDRSQTVAALPRIIQELMQQKYRFVTLRQLIDSQV